MKLSCTAHTPNDLKVEIVNFIRLQRDNWERINSCQVSRIEKHASQQVQHTLDSLANELENMEILP